MRGVSLIEALLIVVFQLLVILVFSKTIPVSNELTADDALSIQAIAGGQEYLDVIRQYIKATGVDTPLPPPTQARAASRR